MKREMGASAGLLALIAVMLHTQFAPGRESTGGSKAEQSDQAPKQAKEKSDERREGPWVATRAFFNKGEAPAPPAPPVVPDGPCGPDDADFSLSCLIDPHHAWDAASIRKLQSFMGITPDDRSHYKTWSIIATMADPSHTRLPLFIDRQVEAVIRAMQVNNFEMTGQWMPWSDRFDSSESDIVERRRQKRFQREQEEMPGVLVFRRFADSEPRSADGSGIREVLFVFVVPETPTSGVNGPPFYAAVRLAIALSGQSRIGYLTPSFSGSFESLTSLVAEWNQSVANNDKIKGTFYGGTASSEIAAERFRKRTSIDFRSGIASSHDSETAFCEALSRYGLKPSDAAYLTEDETEFSSHDFYTEPAPARNSSPCAQIPRYVFPRDISHLRNVYQEEAAPASEGKGQQAQTQGLNFSIKDSGSGEDAVPTFSLAQTPLSQDSVVHSIMNEFRRHRTRLVYIVATNVLDTLFLAQLVRRETPDTRVLTEDPDVLFVAASAQTPLSGTLFLSTYPMSFDGDSWLSDIAQSRRVLFPTPDFQGLYNVSQSVLADIGAVTRKDAAAHERGYAQVKATPTHPALWLLTLNHTGFLPIDSIDEAASQNADQGDRHDQWYGKVPPQGTPASFLREITLPSPPRGWFIAASAATAFAWWICWLTLRANRLNERCRWPVFLTLGYGRKLVAPRLLALISALLAVSVAEWILFLPAWLSTFETPSVWRALLPAGLVGWGAPIVLSVWLWRKTPPRVFRKRAWVYMVLELAVYCSASSAWLWCCAFMGQPASLFFRYRSLELFSESSPALPLFLLALVTLIGSIFYLKRFSRAGFARPCLELVAFKSLSQPLMHHYEGINGHIMGPAQTGLASRRKAEAKRRAIPSLLLLLFMLLLLRPWLHAAAFENPWFNRALSVPITVLLFCLTLASYDLACMWRELDKFLALIDLMPLRPAFRRIARDWPKRPIWALNQHLSKTFLAKQMLAVLHNRRVLLGTSEAAADVACFWASIPSRFNGHHPTEKTPASSLLAAIQSSGAAQVKEESAAAPVPTMMAAVTGPAAAAAVAVATAEKPLTLQLPLIPAHKREPRTTEEEFLRARREHEKLCARLLSRIVTLDLMPIWAKNVNDETAKRSSDEKASDEDRLKTYCSDFVALQFTRYLVYVVSQIQSIAWCLSFCLLMLMLVLISYSPQAPLLLGRFVAGLFVAIGVVVFWVFAGMERNAILSRISGTQPGQLNQEFWFRLIGMGILPLIGVLSHLFPSLSNFFAAWVGSGAEAFR